jgi:formylglycine-generating enzyme
MRPSLLGTFVLGTGLAGLLGLHDAARAKQAPRASLGSRAACRAYSGLPPGFGADPHAGMVLIESGTFAPGSREGYAEERPHALLSDVAVAGFWIDRTEVTNAQFRAFVEATRYVTRAERAGESAVFRAPGEAELGQGELVWWRSQRGASWRHPEGPGSDLGARAHHPVVHIAHEDALAYARWLGRSLPSEDQWEYAALAGLRSEAQHRAPIAADGSPLANFWQGVFPVHDEARDGFAGQAPVGCYPANRFGLYDMIGNVWEWTRDRYRPRSESAHAHAGGAGGCETGASQDPYVIKGGSFLCAANYCARYRVAARHAHEPTTPTAHIGFRTVAYE